MFYFSTVKQLTLWGDDEFLSPEHILDIMRHAHDLFPGAGTDALRRIAFLTHPATQNFLAPMLIGKFGSLDEAKVPTESWLEKTGSLETYARASRMVVNGDYDSQCPASPPKGKDGASAKPTPTWYSFYLASERYRAVRRDAVRWWTEYMGELTCSDNADHPFIDMHHRSYKRLGCDDEYRYLVPKCRECHERMRMFGPSVPSIVPEEVKKWL